MCRLLMVHPCHQANRNGRGDSLPNAYSMFCPVMNDDMYAFRAQDTRSHTVFEVGNKPFSSEQFWRKIMERPFAIWC